MKTTLKFLFTIIVIFLVAYGILKSVYNFESLEYRYPKTIVLNGLTIEKGIKIDRLEIEIPSKWDWEEIHLKLFYQEREVEGILKIIGEENYHFISSDNDIDMKFNLKENHFEGKIFKFKINGNWNKEGLTLDQFEGKYEDYNVSLLEKAIISKNHISPIQVKVNDFVVTVEIDLENNVLKYNLYELVEGSGQFNFDTKEYDLSVLSEDTFINYDFVKGMITGKGRVKGNLEGAKLSGHINVDNATVQIPEKIPELTQTVDITYINQPEDETPPTLVKASKEYWPLEFDLKLNIPGNLTITKKGFRSTWKGDFDITGTLEKPEINGQLVILSGEYNLQDKKLQVNEGSITFTGDPLHAQIYIVAMIEISRKKIEIILRGDLQNPTLTLQSSPSMSKREILSWLIFGKGVSNINPLEQDQLSTSLSELENGSTDEDAFTKMKKAVGIDTLDFSREQGRHSEEVSFKIGKYITKGTIISLKNKMSNEQNYSTTSNYVSIESDIFNNFKVEVEVGTDSTGQLNLLWKKDY